MVTKCNLYDDIFFDSVSISELNFKQRQFLIEIQLRDPESEEMYLLRYLTFNQVTQSMYPKMYITII